MSDSNQADFLEAAQEQLQSFQILANSKNWLKADERKQFKKIQKYVEDLQRRQKNGKPVDQAKFHKELTKKLDSFNALVQFDLEQALAHSGFAKPKEITKKEQSRREQIATGIGKITQSLSQPLPQPKRPSRAAKIMGHITHSLPIYAERHMLYFSRGMSSLRREQDPQKALQKEFTKYAEQLVNFGNNKHGLASNIFPKNKNPNASEDPVDKPKSLADNPQAGLGDFIHKAHDYPLSRDQEVINRVSHYEDIHQNDADNEIVLLCNAITGVNSLRAKIDKIYGFLKEVPPNIDMLIPTLSLVQPESEALAKDLKAINDPEIKKIAKEVIKLADKLTDKLPKDIKHQVEVQQAKEAQLLAPRKKPGSSPHK